MNNLFIIVPSLDPDEKIMATFIKGLHKEFKNIVIVNDGSEDSHSKFFDKLKSDGMVVLTHPVNLGKGRAIKTALNYILSEHPEIEGVITCDCDGQHSINDIKNCAKVLTNNFDKLILGVRNFEDDSVPPKSKFGNKITRNVIRNLIGLDITDTQTGLRGFGKNNMLLFLRVLGERFEYETNMIIECQKRDILIKEVDINTIYIDSNSNTHFSPVQDSIKIYNLFSKYFFLILGTIIIDIFLFSFFLGIIKINSKILAATIMARLLSIVFYYLMNKNLLFKNITIKTKIKYCIMVFLLMIISGCLVTFLFELFDINVIVIKLIVDILLWIASFLFINDFVFDGVKNEKK